jgi:hypothetical protein
LLNSRSLLPKLKIDELSILLPQNRSDIAAVTETWLRPDISSELLSIDGYNLHRADRRVGRGGGVCVFTSIDDIPCKRRVDLESPDLECLWLWLRSYRLPRPLSGIALCAVYNAPGKPIEDQNNLCDHIVKTSDFVRNQYPDCALIILGDFNQLDVSHITSDLDLIQVVNSSTRGVNTLDLIICNTYNLYENPAILAPLGTSDDNIVHWTPKARYRYLNNDTGSFHKRYTRHFLRSGLDAFGRWIRGANWFADVVQPSANNLTDSLTTTLNTMDLTRHQNKPWISHAIKSLIQKRQNAFNNNDPVLWRHYKNKVKKEITKRKKVFYEDKVKHLKNEDCRKWWRFVNSLSGRRNKSQPFTIEKDGSALTDFELAEHLNTFFLSVNEDISPLDINSTPAFLPAEERLPKISEIEAYSKLAKINPYKASGPYNIPARILKEFSIELSKPVARVFNVSLSEGVSRKNICIAKHFAVPPPVSQSFHLPCVEQSQVLAHLLFAAQCITY